MSSLCQVRNVPLTKSRLGGETVLGAQSNRSKPNLPVQRSANLQRLWFADGDCQRWREAELCEIWVSEPSVQRRIREPADDPPGSARRPALERPGDAHSPTWYDGMPGTQTKRISAAIGHGGDLESLLDHLKGLESEIATLSRQNVAAPHRAARPNADSQGGSIGV